MEEFACQECLKKRNMEKSVKISHLSSRMMLFAVFLLFLTLNVCSALHLDEETNAVSPGLGKKSKSSYEYDLPDLKQHHKHHHQHHKRHHHSKRKHFHYKTKKRLWEERRMRMTKEDVTIPQDRIFFQTGVS